MTRLAAAGVGAAIILVGSVAACLLPADARTTSGFVCARDVRVAARGPILRADLDGDRRPDRVWLAGRKSGYTATSANCQFTLMVSGAGGWSAKRAIVPLQSNVEWVPRLLVLAAIDSTRGAEVVIERDEVSSLGLALVLTLRRRHLVTLRAPRTPRNAGGVFTYSAQDAPGGAIQVDCPKPGTVVMSAWTWLGSNDPYTTDPRWYAERRTYRVTRAGFRQVAATVNASATQGEVEKIVLPVGEYRPFVSCAVTHFTW